MTQEIRNYGFSAELEAAHRSSEDEVFGAVEAPCIASIPEAERLSYLPIGERQNIGEEKMDCASRGPVNKAEAKFTYLLQKKIVHPDNEQWLRDNGYVTPDNRVEFSDAYVAVKSGTTRRGNSLKAPLQAIHEFGLVPKKLLPQLDTFETYHDPKRITPEIEALGKELIRRFPIRYQIVYERDYDLLYQEDMLIEAGFAWSVPYNGEYPKVDMPANHVWLGVKRPLHIIFDNYIDTSDGDFIKKLAPDYGLLGYGYRLYIAENRLAMPKPVSVEQKRGLWEALKQFLRAWLPFRESEEVIQKLEPALNPEPRRETPTEALKRLCIASVGKDLSVQAPDELGCADSLSRLLAGVFPDFPSFLSTKALKLHLDSDKRFARSEVEPWTLIVSPTGYGNGSISSGHVGVLADGGIIYSNNSATGKWSAHWTLDEWVSYYRGKGGYPIYVYKLM